MPLSKRAAAPPAPAPAAALPPFTQALAGLRARYGAAVAVDEALLQRLHGLFGRKSQAASAAAGGGGGGAAQLTLPEFVAVLGEAGGGGAGGGMPAAAASLLFSAMDADASGAVSFEEMAVGLAVLARGDVRSRLRLALSAFDTDKKGERGRGQRRRPLHPPAPPRAPFPPPRAGRISGPEVQALIRHATGLGAPESAALAARLLATYDANGDGGLDVDEMSVAVRAHPQLLAAFQWVQP